MPPFRSPFGNVPQRETLRIASPTSSCWQNFEWGQNFAYRKNKKSKFTRGRFSDGDDTNKRLTRALFSLGMLGRGISRSYKIESYVKKGMVVKELEARVKAIRKKISSRTSY